MNIIKIQGGLGNQMFQYALYRKFENSGAAVRADLSWFESNEAEAKRPYLLGEFNIKVNAAPKESVKKYRNFLSKRFKNNFGLWPMIYTEKDSGTFDGSVLKKKNTLFDGYWQTDRYSDGIKDILVKDFCFPGPVSKVEEDYLSDINESESVSVHFRCTDYLLHDDIYGGICTKEYYLKAIKEVLKEIDNPKFFIFSDDIKRASDIYKEICKEALKAENAVFVELPKGTGEIHDMLLMKSCKHNIIANSSFSWWASYLNTNEDKHIYAPSKWKNTKECPDIFGKDWRIID